MGEMGLKTDQHNALVYADPKTPEEEAERAEAWFEELSERANALIAQAGFALCKGNVMTRNALANCPPAALFRRFAIERSGQHRGKVDLKRRGTRPLVDLACLLAMQLSYLGSPNTADRFRHAVRALPDARRSIEDAHTSLAELRFVHQLRRVQYGLPPNNHLDPYALSRTRQSVLQAALSTIRETQGIVARRHGIT
jgi:CBS domain-containing protein